VNYNCDCVFAHSFVNRNRDSVSYKHLTLRYFDKRYSRLPYVCKKFVLNVDQLVYCRWCNSSGSFPIQREIYLGIITATSYSEYIYFCASHEIKTFQYIGERYSVVWHKVILLFDVNDCTKKFHLKLGTAFKVGNANLIRFLIGQIFLSPMISRVELIRKDKAKFCLARKIPRNKNRLYKVRLAHPNKTFRFANWLHDIQDMSFTACMLNVNNSN
jgi:hypothetical protein